MFFQQFLIFPCDIYIYIYIYINIYIYIYIFIYIYIYIIKSKKKSSHNLYTEAALRRCSYEQMF